MSGLGLIERSDLPPPRREPLPTPEQIKAIRDVAALEAMEIEVESRTAKIRVDLEMEVGDDDWDARARKALASHVVVLGRVRKQLHLARKGFRGQSDQTAQEEAAAQRKAAKAVANATQETAAAERAKAKAAMAKSNAEMQRMQLVRSLSFHAQFFKAARLSLDSEAFERLCDAANDALVKAAAPSGEAP